MTTRHYRCEQDGLLVSVHVLVEDVMGNNQCDEASQQVYQWIFTEFTGGFTALIFPDCSQTARVPVHRPCMYLCTDHTRTCA